MIEIKNQIIDIHTHILPGVDDGSKTMEESCQMLRAAAKQGVTAVIATPHDSRRYGCTELQMLVRQLEQRIQKLYPEFRIYLGQETYYVEELTEALKVGDARTLNGSRYVLVEFQPRVSYQMLSRGIRQLFLSGYTPVLAHMERYLCLRQEKNLCDLLESGCKLQMNYESIQGSWIHTDVRWCRKQVKQGRIHLLGSDMHRMDYRPPELEEAIRWLNGHVEAWLTERMTYHNPLRIINNEYMS